MTTRYQQMKQLRERAMDAALTWTDKMRRKNPRIMYVETEAYARGFEAGWREAKKDRGA